MKRGKGLSDNFFYSFLKRGVKLLPEAALIWTFKANKKEGLDGDKVFHWYSFTLAREKKPKQVDLVSVNICEAYVQNLCKHFLTISNSKESVISRSI